MGSGANVTLLEPYDAGVLQGLREIGGMNVVSDLQLYLDLRSYGARGEEAARAIFEQRIKPFSRCDIEIAVHSGIRRPT